MALAPTLHDFQVALSHVDRGFDRELVVKAARHPSETLERVWLRVIAYCLLWEERIAFGPGLCDPEAPDLETLDYTGRRSLWVRVGKADPVKVQKACDHNPGARVVVLFDSPERMRTFLEEASARAAARLERAELAAVSPELLAVLAAHDERRTRLTLTIVGDHLYLDRAGQTLEAPIERATLA